MSDDDFDAAAFLDWLAAQDGPIPKVTLHDQWPTFPFDQLGVGITMQYDPDTGELLYYKRDVRLAAKMQPNLD
jgi:hypothetical protein